MSQEYSRGVSIIRGITLRHPWSWAFLHGKDVENRTWRPERMGGHVGMFLALHGGKWTGGEDYISEVQQALNWALEGKLLGRSAFPNPEKVVLGDLVKPGIVAVGRLIEVRQDSSSGWAIPGQWHWCLEVTPLPETIPHRGAQGLWSLEEGALQRVRELYRAALRAEGKAAD